MTYHHTYNMLWAAFWFICYFQSSHIRWCLWKYKMWRENSGCRISCDGPKCMHCLLSIIFVCPSIQALCGFNVIKWNPITMNFKGLNIGITWKTLELVCIYISLPAIIRIVVVLEIRQKRDYLNSKKEKKSK